MSYRSVNPATGETLASFKDHNSKEIEAKLTKACETYRDWRKLAIHVRCKYLSTVADLLEARKEDYAKLITQEMGKPIAQSVSEVEKCAWVCRYYAEHAKLLLKDEVIKTDAEQSYVSYEPIGPVLAIMPWNFPFWQVFRFAAPALAAGNVGLLKHASNVPQCAQAIGQIFLDAGCPEGAFTNLFISSSRVKKLIESDKIVAVTLTGSEGAGSKVAEQSGREIKKTVLELGGSDPFVVLREANIKEAAKVAVKARMINTGQSCIAAKRIIVEQSIAASFLKLLKAEMEKLKVGDPMQEDTDIGPMAREDLVKDLHDQVRSSIKKGAKAEMGGQKPKRTGYYYKPTLLTSVKPGMAAYDEEVFGPVLPVIIAESDEQAIALANQTRFGLGAAVWTENQDQIQRAVKQLQAGNVVVNGMVASDPRLPFGGIKKSGYGRELSHFGIKEFVNIKSVVIH